MNIRGVGCYHPTLTNFQIIFYLFKLPDSNIKQHADEFTGYCSIACGSMK